MYSASACLWSGWRRLRHIYGAEICVDAAQSGRGDSHSCGARRHRLPLLRRTQGVIRSDGHGYAHYEKRRKAGKPDTGRHGYARVGAGPAAGNAGSILESGTQNVPGILALGAGMDFVRTNGEDMLREREMRHIRRVYEAFKNMPHVVLYTAMPDTMYFVPVLGFNVRGMQSEEVGEVLAKRNIAVRCGFHCAPLVHRKMGTDGETPGGAVRVSPGAFTDRQGHYGADSHGLFAPG